MSKLTKTGTLIIEADDIKSDGREGAPSSASVLKRGTRFCGIEQAQIAFGIDFPGVKNPFDVDVVVTGAQPALSQGDGFFSD